MGINLKNWRLRRVIGVLFTAIGVVLAAVTAVHAATFDPEETITIDVPAAEKSSFVYTDPGVLNLINSEPKVLLRAADAEIQWAPGTTSDVTAYVGKSGARKVAGFSADGITAAIEDQVPDSESAAADAEVIEAGGFALHESDMWLQAGSGKDQVELPALALEQGLDRSLIATTSAGTAPQLTLTWIRTKEFASPAPFILIGVLIALIGVVLLLTDWRDGAHRRELAAQAENRRAHKAAHASAETTVLPALKDEIADPALDRAVKVAYTGAALGAGVLPSSPRTAALRERPLAAADRIVISQDAAAPAAPADNSALGNGAAAVPAAAAVTNSTAETAADPSTLWEFTVPFDRESSAAVPVARGVVGASSTLWEITEPASEAARDVATAGGSTAAQMNAAAAESMAAPSEISSERRGNHA